MSFEHKYLKYKQKYLELKSQLESMQQVGGDSNKDSILDLDKLSDTPTNNNKKNFNQLAGYLQDSSEYFKNSETDTTIEEVNELTETDTTIEEVNELTETPKENTMVVNIDSSTDESNDKESDTDSSDVKQDNTDDSEDDDSSSPSEQEGGNLETSISELDEIFSQLGGKKKKKKDSSSENSSLSSLSSLEDSSSDFDF